MFIIVSSNVDALCLCDPLSFINASTVIISFALFREHMESLVLSRHHTHQETGQKRGNDLCGFVKSQVQTWNPDLLTVRPAVFLFCVPWLPPSWLGLIFRTPPKVSRKCHVQTGPHDFIVLSP